ncbi:disease resistance protein At4g27190-like [Rhodamnia argentea]|uniref:Disease resistance protein At4g27190-like n=1 Tax=Rhodamnia argentea TaxID=178133 RepID=A0ABM3HF68_9MYRT|nr:disease resistance protein At4g27190-like [Rhodamnia argentea]
MSIDSAVSIAWDVLKWVVVPIKRQFGYVISSKSYANGLQEEVQKLANESQRVHILAEVARNNLRIFNSGFTEWQASAEMALEEAKDLSGKFEGASKSCCRGTLPDPVCRYQFSRKAKEKMEALRQLTRKCSEFKELNDISFSLPAPGNVTAPTPGRREGKEVMQSTTPTASASSASTAIKDDDVFESRAQIIRDIMDALADNSNRVVGVYGMGGVGKSTLLVDAERRLREEKLFDLVAKADVSENPDINKIQGEIAHALGLSDIKNEDIVSVRAELLRTRLEKEEREKKKVLIILDNLWKGLDLRSVGIPCGHDNKVIGCKLLLTSRFEDVLRREMGCDRDFLLDVLKKEEAKRLFEKTVGDKVHHDPFESLVDEALRKCAGLPFLIIAMGNIFRDANFYEWKDVLRQIEMSTNKGISERINEMLQLSYDRFKGEDGKDAKSLLRLCVVYGVSKPSLENLVRYGVGSRLFREDSSMEEVRDRLSSLIRALISSSLLLKDDEDVDGFKIHDLVRGFVMSVASRDDPLLVLRENDKLMTELPKDKLKSCTAVCFPYVDMKELPEELDCPEMRIFLLFTNNESLKVPYSYFNTMSKLMVLHLSQVRLTRSPSPFQSLENLHTLCLDGCSLDDVAMIGELNGLHVLGFVNSKIQRLPNEIGQLIELRLLDLNHCSQLEIIEPGVLGSLVKLEELYMENSFDRWNVVEQTPPTNAGLIELNKLKNLYTLHVSILDPSVLPHYLNVEKLTKYQIQIGEVPRWRSRNGSSTLELKLDPMSDILQKECIQTLLGKTDDLFLEGLNGIEQSICVLSRKVFPKLKHLQVENSPSINYILQSPSHTEFKMLESLLLKNLINLEKICYNHISSNSFKVLKVVRVESCDKMEVLFPLSLLRELPRLEEIQVVICHLMREIVEVDDCDKVELRNLRVLNLHDLPNIKNFVTNGTAPSSSTSNDQGRPQVAFFNGQQIVFPSLETLRIVGMDSIEIIWDNQVAAESFRKLKSLIVYGCNKLANIVPSYILGRLKSLESLEVGSYARASPLCFQPQ